MSLYTLSANVFHFHFSSWSWDFFLLNRILWILQFLDRKIISLRKNSAWLLDSPTAVLMSGLLSMKAIFGHRKRILWNSSHQRSVFRLNSLPYRYSQNPGSMRQRSIGGMSWRAECWINCHNTEMRQRIFRCLPSILIYVVSQNRIPVQPIKNIFLFTSSSRSRFLAILLI